jgi:hypothetical protein
LLAGAAVAEWGTLRHERLQNSELSRQYLHSIDPGYKETAAW